MIIYIFHRILDNLKFCRTLVAVGHCGVLQTGTSRLCFNKCDMICYATAVTSIEFGNPKIVVFIGSASFDHVIDVIADDVRMLYFVVEG